VLAFLGYGLAFGAVAATVHWSLWLPWRSAALLGGVFGCTSSTVVMPVLQQLKVRAPVRVTLLLESALGDVIAVLMVSTLLRPSTGVAKFSGFMGGFLRDAGIGSGMGAVAGLLWWWLWPRLAPQKFSNTVAFGVVLGIYAATHAVGGSGLLAVLAFGLILGNLPNRGDIAAQEMQFLSFHSELSFLVRSFFFVLLGVIVEFLGKDYVLPILAILGALLVSRFLAVQISRIALRGISAKERELLLMMMPRGLITAVLAVQVVEAKGGEFLFLPAMAFTTILATNLLLVAGSIRSAPEAVVEQPAASQGESSESPQG